MTFHVRWGLVFRIAGIALLALVACLFAFVQIQQHLLRWRAERLLADIRAIQMGKSTWADAQQLMNRWGAFGSWESECSARTCKYKIFVAPQYESIMVRIDQFAEFVGPVDGRWGLWLDWIWSRLGADPGFASGGFIVKDGDIWGKWFSVNLAVQDRTGFDIHEYLLTGGASSATHFYHERNAVLEHPEYYQGRPGACEGCIAAYAEFTPFADSAVTNRLLDDINLDCLTRLFPRCRGASDVMPEATKADAARRAHWSASNRSASCDIPLEVLGRDNRYVATARLLTRKNTTEDGDPRYELTFKVLERLKGRDDLQSGTIAKEPVRSEQIHGAGNDKDAHLRLGGEYILAINGPIGHARMLPLNLDQCGVIPLTDANLAAIRRGIERDVLPDEERSLF